MIACKTNDRKNNGERGHLKPAKIPTHNGGKNEKKEEKYFEKIEPGKGETKKTVANHFPEEQKSPTKKTMERKRRSAEVVIERTRSKEPAEEKRNKEKIPGKPSGEKINDGSKHEKKEEKEKKVGQHDGEQKKVHLLKDGQILLDKFRVEGLLADGGFAQVFSAIHEDTCRRWAVKIESEKCDRKRMKLEILLLMLLRGKENIPEITAMGTCSMGHFFIMELVGRNLSDLRRQLPHRRLSPGTLYRAMLQVTHALSLVHGAGFLHRDLKPSNCCIGVDHVTRIYLLDYGLARQYIDSSGLMRKPRESIGMRGTLRYVSLEAHARHDLGPSHDLVALLYSIIELGDGRLPWSKMRDEAAIKASKMGTTVEKLCEKQPKMLKMAEHILAMKYDTMPDYGRLTKMLESCHPAGVEMNDPYDWQKIPCKLMHDVKKMSTSEPQSGADKHGHTEQQLKDVDRASLVSEMERIKIP